MNAIQKILGITKILLGIFLMVTALVLSNRVELKGVVYVVAICFVLILIAYHGFYLFVSGRKQVIGGNVKRKALTYIFIGVNLFFLTAFTVSFIGKYTEKGALVEFATVGSICAFFLIEEIYKLIRIRKVVNENLGMNLKTNIL